MDAEQKRRLRKNLIKASVFIITMGLLIAILVYLTSPAPSEKLPQQVFDELSQQKPVQSAEALDSVYYSFGSLSASEIRNREYLSFAKAMNKKYEEATEQGEFLVVKGNDIYKYLVGKFRVKEFLPKDTFFVMNRQVPEINRVQYLKISLKLLHKVLQLQKELARLGYDPEALEITSGFRYPAYNENIGGAGKSRHMYGQAVDLKIHDINQDGTYTNRDKEIVLEILDKKVIKDEGGVGLYPGTQIVHMDVRGYRARWNSW